MVMVNSSPGIIIVASSKVKRRSLPLNSSRAKAKAERTVITRERMVELTPTIMVFTNKLPRSAVLKASR